MQTNTSSFPFCLQYGSVLFTLPGHKSFFFFGSYFDCDVTVCSVRYDVLLGMEFVFFFQVKLFETGFSSYSEISLISLFFNYV